MTQLALLPSVEQELKHRLELFQNLPGGRLPKTVSPNRLNSLGIYRGGSGIWFDKERTRVLSSEGTGVTVSVLYTGALHTDELASDGIIYHYPETERSQGRDQSEIDATKEAAQLGLPVFVVAYPSRNALLRDVWLGWVEGWDDRNKTFLITFDSLKPMRLIHEINEDDETFHLIQSMKNRDRRWQNNRPGEQRFKFRVMRRYGGACVLCGITLRQLLDAVHIRPKKYQGSDDPRNGLLLCSTHRRAFDAEMFGIEPDTLSIKYRGRGPDRAELKVSVDDLTELLKYPHIEALAWWWARWNHRDS